ncbi:MAG: molecular chaperone DnaK [Deltaproteobacteria bacterium]|nr:MAG: molecular chaperone DnaK [Deltaproteobacteria bacterium]
MEGRDPKVIENEEGNRLTPSVVGFSKDGEILVGQVARRQAITNPENTVYSIKRFMGRKFEETADERRRVPFKVVKADNGDAVVEIQGKKWSPPEISAKILQKLKRAAENYLGETVGEAVLDKKKDEIVAVFDYGGGTFDISILEVGENVVEVVATNGDTHLGGDDMDQKIMDWLIQEFRAETSIDLSKDKMVLQRLKEASEKAKIELSSTMETEINLPFLTADQTGPKHLVKRLSRAKFEQMCEDLFQRALEPTKKCLADAKKNPKEIDEVILVGGATRVPKLQQIVKDFFGKEPNRSVNPDEVVAIGAAVQGGVLTGEVKDILLLDVTPLSLSIETLGGVATQLIQRNTTIPTKKSEVFSTAADGQTSVEVHVLQGERPMARDNKTLGRFHLDGIPPAPRGVPQIEVTFDIDANGIVHVAAKDRATGKENKITITASSGLSKEDVDRAVKEAQSHEAEDKQRRDEIEVRNRADNLAYATEKSLKDLGDKIPAATKSELEAKVKAVRDALAGSDVEAVKSASESLMQSSHRMAEEAYKAAGGAAEGAGGAGGPDAGGQPGGQAGGAKKDDVVDAEFEEQK